MRRRSRSSDELTKWSSELDWSEEVFNNAIVGGPDGIASSRARSIVGRRKSLLESFRDNYSNVNLMTEKIGGNRRFSQKVTKKAKRSSSIVKFPSSAFTINSSAEFHNPDLFSEVYSMTFVSASIFALAEVRQAARDGKINAEGLHIVSTPVVVGSIVKAFTRNEEYFETELKAGDYDFLSSLARITDVDTDSDENLESNGERDRKKKALLLMNALSIEYFGDDNVKSECLYMITRNPNTSRIGLIFRGSTTIQDWIKDSKLVVSDIENPVADRPDQPPRIGVHRGFREYLYGELRTVPRGEPLFASLPEENDEEPIVEANNSPTGKDSEQTQNMDIEDPSMGNDEISNGTQEEEQLSTSVLLNFLGLDLKEKQKNLWKSIKWSKSQLFLSGESEEELEDSGNHRSSGFMTLLNSRKSDTNKTCRLSRILDEIKSLLRQYRNYKIYITGHSLGGALGLLASLEIAERFGTLSLPVTFVGIGNPRAGTEGFRDAVKVLEREGKLRCMSVHGQYDIVGMLPTSTFMRTTKRRFCQSGFELILDSESNKFHVRRSERPDENYMQRIGLAIFRADKIAERHHYVTYLRELEGLERPLQKLHLNDFYDKFVDQSLFPCSKQKMTPVSIRSSRDFNRESVVILQRPSMKEMKRVLSADDLCSEEFEF